jgi:type IV pilus assembly protein PilW
MNFESINYFSLERRARIMPKAMKRRERGFTLVELMIVLVLTSIATVGMYRSYVSFTTSAEVEEQKTELNQNMRIALNRMVREFRMAGYDPLGTAEAGFTAVALDDVTFSMDSIETGDPATVETVRYQYDNANKELERNGIAVVQNVSALQFRYFGLDGVTETAVLDNIRSVQISLVVETTNEDFSYRDTRAYTNTQGSVLIAQNDHRYRKMLTGRVNCRNMGLD